MIRLIRSLCSGWRGHRRWLETATVNGIEARRHEVEARLRHAEQKPAGRPGREPARRGR